MGTAGSNDAGFHHLIAPYQPATQGCRTSFGSPTAHHKAERTIRRHPLAVVLADNMQMSPRGNATLARGMPDMISCLNPCANRYALISGDVQVNDIPTGLLKTISIHINDHGSIFRTHHQPRSGSIHPRPVGVAARF